MVNNSRTRAALRADLNAENAAITSWLATVKFTSAMSVVMPRQQIVQGAFPNYAPLAPRC
jgi:hypothetical protein